MKCKALFLLVVVSTALLFFQVTSAPAGVLFADDFESGVVSSSWTGVEAIEVIADVTGERPAFVASLADTENPIRGFLFKDIPIGPGTTIRGFVYENGADDGDDIFWGLDGSDGSTAFSTRSSLTTFPSSFDFYMFDPTGGVVFTTSVERTVGWHEFRLVVTSSGTGAFIDGIFVGSSPITTYEQFAVDINEPSSGGNPVYWDDFCIFTGDESACSEAATVNLDIDIKPGSDPNSINLGSAGVIPVAILSSDSFNAPTEVNPDRLALAGASVKVAGKSSKNRCHNEDVNNDGLTDLICQFENELNAEIGDSVAVLEGETFDGRSIRGEDSINIVQN